MINREALEDAVYQAHPDLEMDDIERMPNEKLLWMLDEKRKRQMDKKQERREDKVRESAIKKQRTTFLWEKVGTSFEVRDGVLLHVERWHTSNEAGQTVREYVQHCGERVFYEGRMVSSSILRWFLLTGQWVKRIPKPKRYRAVVRSGSRVVHLGYFPTEADRDAAVFAWKLGLRENT